MNTNLVTVCGAFVFSVIITSLWQVPLLAAAGWIGLRIAGNSNASTRCAVWTVVLLASAILPTVTTAAHFLWVPGAVGGIMDVTLHTARNGDFARGAAPFVPMGTVIIPAYLGLAVFGLWVVVVCAEAYRLRQSLARLSLAKNNAFPLAVEIRQQLLEFNRAARGWRNVRLGMADIDVPVAAGIFDSLILLPSALLDKLNSEEIDRICVHELAHLRRGDDWSILLEFCIATLYRFNPFFQLIIRQIEIDREIACDDWVLRSVSAPEDYAGSLIHLAEAASIERKRAILFSQFAGRKSISLRIEDLLRAGRNASTRIAPLRFILAGTLLAACAAFAVVSAPLRFVASASEVTLDSKQKKDPGAWEFVDAVEAGAMSAGGHIVIFADARLSTICDEAIIVHDAAQGPDSYNLLGRQKPRPGRYCPVPRATYSARQRFADDGTATVLLHTRSGVRILRVNR